jgi:hypothetical protein
MDNIIEIIVFFFVIYSILSSILGKKKPQQKKNQQQYKSPVPQRKSPSAKPVPSQTSSQDILEELFGIKVPKPEEETGYNKQIPNENLEYQSWDPEKDFEKKVKQKDKYEKGNIEKDLPDVNYDKFTTLETTKKKVKVADPIIFKDKREVYNRSTEVKRKLKTQKTLRELFLISEILSKPRAFRRIK